MKPRLTSSKRLSVEQLEIRRLLAGDAVDLMVDVDDGEAIVYPGHRSEYVIRVTNKGEVDAIDAVLSVQIDPNLVNRRWPLGEFDESGIDDLNEVIEVFSGETKTYFVSGTVGREIGQITVTASVSPGETQTETNPDDNFATDVNDAPRRYQVPYGISQVHPCFEDTAISNGELFCVGLGWWDYEPCFSTRALASSGFYGGHLWKTDGTVEGTTIVKEIVPPNQNGPLGWPSPLDAFTNPEMAVLNDIVYFAADDWESGEELWRSDGTEEGTYMVKDIAEGPRTRFFEYLGNAEINPGSEIDNLAANSQFLFFSANDEVHGRELWRSDGTEAGTLMVQDIYSGTESAFSREAVGQYHETHGVVYKDHYFFIADDGVHGRELWSSDGTIDGTNLVRDITPGPSGSFPDRSERFWHSTESASNPRFQVYDDLLYFRAGEKLWQTDGTLQGTQELVGKLPISASPKLEFDGAVIVYDDGNFLRINPDGEQRLIATWTKSDLPSSWMRGDLQPTWMRVIEDHLVFAVSVGSDLPGTRFYSVLLEPTDVHIHAETVSGSVRVPLHATDIVAHDSDQREPHVLPEYSRNDNDFLRRLSTIPLGWNNSITFAFPNVIVDQPGVEIITDVPWRRLTLEGIDIHGDVHPLGIANFGSEFDLAAHPGIPPLAALRFTRVPRGNPPREPQAPMAIPDVRVMLDVELILTARTTNNLDLEFTWDLNSDGNFGDRTGRSIGLTTEEMKTFGIAEPGDYDVSVRVDDRVSHWTQTQSVTIPVLNQPTKLFGDIDGDQEVSFADFLILYDNYTGPSFSSESNASYEQGDLNADGQVNWHDLRELRIRYGQTLK